LRSYIRNINKVFWLLIFIILSIFLTGLTKSSELHHSNVLNLQDVYDSTAFRIGLDLLINHTGETLKNKPIAIIANRGSNNRDGQHNFDVVKNILGNQCRSFIQVMEGEASSGNTEFIYHDSELDSAIRYFTLTASDHIINAKILNGAALVVIDLQDSGLRESLMLGVLIEVLKFGAETQTPVIILDRPNPLQTVEIGGPISTQAKFSIGYSVPVRHGLTLGEMAFLLNEENWLKTKKYTPLTVIKMANYHRNMSWQQTGLKWYFSDESVRDEETAILYAGLYFFQYTNISLGTGTIQPYQFIGAPWISADVLADVIERQKLLGLEVHAVKFTPHRDETSAVRPLYQDTECSGISVRVSDCAKFDSYQFGIILLDAISRLYPRHFEWTQPAEADLFFGSADFRTWVNIGADLKPMLADWNVAVTTFQKLRLKYCLYPFQKK